MSNSTVLPVTVGRGRILTKSEAKVELTGWSRSGQSLAGYARERGIAEKTFWNWRSRLKAQGWEPVMGASDGVTGASDAGIGASDADMAVAGLIPVRIVESPVSPVPASRSSFEVLLGTGIVVRVPSDFDKGPLRRLLEVVSEC